MKESAFNRIFTLKKVFLIGTITIIFLLLSSCAVLFDLALETALGRNTCSYPGCNNSTIENSSYCFFHTPSYLMGPAYIEIDTKNAYKLYKPLQINDTTTIKTGVFEVK